MEGVALGALGWKPDDFSRYTAADLIQAVKGYDQHERNAWERVRAIAAYSSMPHHDSKKYGPMKWSDIILPIDKPKKIKKEDLATAKRLTREQVKEQWKKAGLQIPDYELDRMTFAEA